MADKDLVLMVEQGGSFAALFDVIFWATQKLVPVLDRIRETVELMQKAFFEKLDANGNTSTTRRCWNCSSSFGTTGRSAGH